MAGISRQAYYKSKDKNKKQNDESRAVLQMALVIRYKHPYISCKKIYSMIKPMMSEQGIKIGRDKFIGLMVENGYNVNRRRHYKQTTNSNHSKPVYRNLINHLAISYANQAWVCDITYLKTTDGYAYLSLVTDLYSRRILGYSIGNDLSTANSITALRMAIQESNARQGGTIHHSDRGIQYCSKEYIDFLKKNSIQSSMTKGGNPYENVVAERINGILKHEYGISDKSNSRQQCAKLVKQAIELYNNERPHLSLGMKTPSEVYYECYKKAE